MSYTLLELVQSILSSMDGDEVNSYSDTQESRQVATIIKDAYYEMIYRLDPPLQYTLFELEASGDNAKPTIMYLPDNARDIQWLKYDNKLSTDSAPKFKEVLPKPLDEFLNYVYNFDITATNVDHFTHQVNDNTDTIDFFCYNDSFPKLYTTFDNYTIVFDGYNSDEDTTLTKSKTLAYGKLLPTFTLSDTFVPDLDEAQFPLLLNEAKVQAFAELRQTENLDASRRARRQWVKSSQNKSRVKPYNYYRDKLPNYGRTRP